MFNGLKGIVMQNVSSASPRLYGRRKGRPLGPYKSGLMESLLPRVRVALPQKGQLDPGGLFARKPKAVWLEVGFGGGEHLAAQATKNPALGYIGCEPFMNGVAGLLALMDRQKLDNIRLHPDDARVLLDVLPNAGLDGCFVLYPDPWPKKRHAERRFINPANLDRLARTLKPGAALRMATDVASLADWMREQVRGHAGFRLDYDSATPPSGWVATRYENKGLKAGRIPCYLVARKC